MKQKTKIKSNSKATGCKKGFSLIETLISILVFSLAMTIIAQTFGSFIKSYVSEKKSQIDVENAQYALNLIEKTIRTSTIQTANASGVLDFNGADGKMIKMFDNSQSKCVAYRFNANKIEKLTKAGTDNDISTCGNFVDNYTVSDLTSNNISSMNVQGKISSLGEAGKISVALVVSEPASTKSFNVALTVSLRNFDPLITP